MNPTTVFLYSIPLFIFTLTAPIIVLFYIAFFKRVNRLTTKQAIITWACIIGYYALFFTQVPKVTVPYFQENSHEVQECIVKRVWNDE